MLLTFFSCIIRISCMYHCEDIVELVSLAGTRLDTSLSMILRNGLKKVNEDHCTHFGPVSCPRDTYCHRLLARMMRKLDILDETSRANRTVTHIHCKHTMPGKFLRKNPMKLPADRTRKFPLLSAFPTTKDCLYGITHER